MANTYKLISSYAATGTVASIDFTSIPATYTDLMIVGSVRPTALADIFVKFNTLTTNQTARSFGGVGAGAGYSATGVYFGTPQVATANTFASFRFYIPNYASANYKPWSSELVSENHTTTAYMSILAGLWSATAAITSLSFYFSGADVVQYSTAYLYGIKNS